MKKASKVYVRYRFEDLVWPLNEEHFYESQTPYRYKVGYEDIDGKKCDKEGNYLKNK